MSDKVEIKWGSFYLLGYPDEQDKKTINIQGNIDAESSYFFPNVEKICFSHKNLRTKTIERVLKCVDIEKIKKLHFFFHQTKSVFSIVQKQLLEQKSQNFNSVKFQFYSTKDTYANEHDYQTMTNFMDFVVPLSKRIHHLDIEIMEHFKGDKKFQIFNFMTHFKNLKTIKISLLKTLKDLRIVDEKQVETDQGQFQNTTKKIFESMKNNDGLESIHIVTHTSEKIPVDSLLQILKNNENSIHTLIIDHPLITFNTLQSYFDAEICDLLAKFERLPKLKCIGGKNTFQTIFSKWKYQFSYNSLKRLKQSVDKKQSHETIKKILRETNINLFNCFQLQCMFNILKETQAQHLMIEAIDNFLFVDHEEIQNENNLFEYMFVHNCDEQLATRFIHQIGKENIEQNMSIFLNQMRINFERHYLSPYFRIGNQTTMIKTMFRISNNLDSKHPGGSTYQQYLYFYFPHLCSQIVKNKKKLCIEHGTSEKQDRSSKRLKMNHTNQSSKTIDHIPDDCVREIFSFVEKMHRVRLFQEWKCLQLVCKRWRDICSNTLEKNKIYIL